MIATRAPERLSRRVIALPIPLAPPVITATLSGSPGNVYLRSAFIQSTPSLFSSEHCQLMWTPSNHDLS